MSNVLLSTFWVLFWVNFWGSKAYEIFMWQSAPEQLADLKVWDSNLHLRGKHFSAAWWQLPAQMYTSPHSTTPKLCCWNPHLTYNCFKGHDMIHNLNIFNCISCPLYVQIIQFLDFEQCLQYDCKSGREKWNWHSSSSSQTHDSHVDKQTGQCSFWLRLQILTKLTHFHNVFPSQADYRGPLTSDRSTKWNIDKAYGNVLRSCYLRCQSGPNVLIQETFING